MSSLIFTFILVLVPHVVLARVIRKNEEVVFGQNYNQTWGGNHFVTLNQGKEVLLTMDNSSGAGFASKMNFGSGLFHMKVKVPGTDSAGIVTAYYLKALGNLHEELDFEFLGNSIGKPYALQTNVFANGVGNREHKIHLWFDPTADFHDYKILWNAHQIVFYVDNIPIRVYKNYTNIGASYPSRPMQIQISLWNGEDWATDGGKTKINWKYAPFKAYFQGFDVSGCPSLNPNLVDPKCFNGNFRCNDQKYWELSPAEEKQLENVKKNYVIYDYCIDRTRYPTTPIECQH